VQEECEETRSPKAQTLVDTAAALHTQLPFKINTTLAQQVYHQQLKPLPDASASSATADAPEGLLRVSHRFRAGRRHLPHHQ
jgi:hypothetical protein